MNHQILFILVKSHLFPFISIKSLSLKKLRQEEAKLGEDLQQKYGDGTINLEKGEFTSN